MNRHLTALLPGTGGQLKATPEDFRVDEVALWEPSGEGAHRLLHVEKRAITTHEVVQQLARTLRVAERDIGFAGIKDARAVATQWLTVPAAAEPRLADLSHPRFAVLQVIPHSSKLRVGELAGNRFAIVLREVDSDALARAQAILAVLARRGVPNWFGAQRFGTKGDSDQIGAALARNDCGEALALFLGRPSPQEHDPRARAARQAFDEGRLDDAAALLPMRMRLEAVVLHAYRDHGDPLRALWKISKRLRLLFLSAFQARLFNRCLEARFDTLDRLQEGDVAVRHDTEKAYPVLDPARDQPRADAFELSPAGPLFGPGLLRARAGVAELEERLFAAEGIGLEHRAQPFHDLHLRGERRPYRFPLREAAVALQPDGGLRLTFELPRGCYATSVVAEVTKSTASGAEEAEESAAPAPLVE